jgi:hypothetical protein
MRRTSRRKTRRNRRKMMHRTEALHTVTLSEDEKAAIALAREMYRHIIGNEMLQDVGDIECAVCRDIALRAIYKARERGEKSVRQTYDAPIQWSECDGPS